MNIHQINIFAIAAKTLSITKTARTMNLSQPSVSIQIKDLEDSLGVRLFDRMNRRIALTDAGKVFFEYAQRLLGLIEEIDAVMKGFSAGDAGRIVLGASSTVGVYVLPRFLGEFKERYPRRTSPSTSSTARRPPSGVWQESSTSPSCRTPRGTPTSQPCPS